MGRGSDPKKLVNRQRAAATQPPLLQPTAPLAGAIAAFFQELGEQLQLPLSNNGLLSAGLPFIGPGKVICRVQIETADNAFTARPEIILPLDEREIRRIQVDQLLSVQHVLLSQMEWVLGHSPETLLQIFPLAWSRTSQEVAAQLDLGVCVADMVMETLRPPGETPEPSPSTH